ncbi:tRNA (adenosine(37)-N6)-threonylcarbamoyltransferase complex ATPase subunit type 1 TsaE [Calycomorphotria hydatis]|uniref:tRNA threonylcarbamoyladenosine biosynthesis protein TsaE n=1 Tax=Calycomorphotria hydatis TaxID=2528027 RepID=A0A517TA99_9PLAN|nr:tRNA (adenosine(37)-N6)-threonylcarbamoyltransferase complex ATPase subunit type 1 TsaE [Calycomorphotria hydatis]QDT65295.1 tRNA threonylcarbamoyladenosine biosynthesis protein TsaE [Calycomorphotria hydatis]
MSEQTLHKSINFSVDSETGSESVGLAIARLLKPGDVIALQGNLGAGKTRLVRAIATNLGVPEEEISSPTFVLIKQYQGDLTIYHFDTYRLGDADEFTALGADELLFGDGVCLIEWADRVAELLPKDHLRIELTATGETSRSYKLTSSGARSHSLLTDLAASLKNCPTVDLH